MPYKFNPFTGTFDIVSSPLEPGFQLQREDLLGSEGTGSSGDPSRVYTLTTTDTISSLFVFLDGVLLSTPEHYSFNTSTNTLTMSNTQTVVDYQIITVQYYVG